MITAQIELWAAIIFAVAVVHTFFASQFAKLAQRQTHHAGIWLLLSEVEVVFGFWAMILLAVIALYAGTGEAVHYLESRNFTEPLFVFVIMVLAASQPILAVVRALVAGLVKRMPMSPALAYCWVVLAIVPLLGSFITEPAAMTLAALMLHEKVLKQPLPESFRYGLVGVLFVNISIGGVLTPYAAPPVLMVAGKWGWDTAYMMQHFGWKAALAVLFNASMFCILFRSRLGKLSYRHDQGQREVPWLVSLIHLLLLSAVVMAAHHPAVFMGIFMLFLGIVQAYPQYQQRLLLKEGMLVGFFLAGLITLGGMQQWWLQSLIASLDSTVLYYGATALTAVTDNAALTYLGSLVEGVDESFKYALVAGAVTGGGLTVIANAPNPAGFSLLKGHFANESIHPGKLFMAACLPTLVAIIAFRCLG